MNNCKLDYEICELIGAIIGDGHIEKKSKRCHYTIQISGDKRHDKEYLMNYLSQIINKNFPKSNIKFSYRKNKNAIYLTINNKYMYYYLVNNFNLIQGPKTFTVRIPDNIIKSDKNLINATIRGIFDTDGCFFLDKRKIYKYPYPRITLSICSEPLFMQLSKYLSESFKIYNGKRKNKDIYYIEIYGHKQIEKWMKEIGFSNPRHKNKIERYILSKNL